MERILQHIIYFWLDLERQFNWFQIWSELHSNFKHIYSILRLLFQFQLELPPLHSDYNQNLLYLIPNLVSSCSNLFRIRSLLYSIFQIWPYLSSCKFHIWSQLLVYHSRISHILFRITSELAVEQTIIHDFCLHDFGIRISTELLPYLIITCSNSHHYLTKLRPDLEYNHSIYGHILIRFWSCLVPVLTRTYSVSDHIYWPETLIFQHLSGFLITIIFCYCLKNIIDVVVILIHHSIIY